MSIPKEHTLSFVSDWVSLCTSGDKTNQSRSSVVPSRGVGSSMFNNIDNLDSMLSVIKVCECGSLCGVTVDENSVKVRSECTTVLHNMKALFFLSTVSFSRIYILTG